MTGITMHNQKIPPTHHLIAQGIIFHLQQHYPHITTQRSYDHPPGDTTRHGIYRTDHLYAQLNIPIPITDLYNLPAKHHHIPCQPTHTTKQIKLGSILCTETDLQYTIHFEDAQERTLRQQILADTHTQWTIHLEYADPNLLDQLKEIIDNLQQFHIHHPQPDPLYHPYFSKHGQLKRIPL